MQGTNWQQIIWREWRHCIDAEYGLALYRLVATEAAGWGARATLMLFNALTGATLALLLGGVITLQWSVLRHFAWAGAVVGLAWGYLAGRELIWHSWLQRLETNTPGDSLSRLLFSGGLLALAGTMVFGPVIWLMIPGLYWGMGDVIHWLKRGLTEPDGYNPEDRRWWFWWRTRPSLQEVEAALRQACLASPAASASWAAPLHRLTEPTPEPVSPEALITGLLSQDWVDRFVARHRLLSLGSEAVASLQAAADGNDSPLRHTARRLLQNMEA